MRRTGASHGHDPERRIEQSAASSVTYFGLQLEVARRRHAQRVDAAPVGTLDLELETADLDRLAAPRHAAQLVQHESADRVEFLVGEARAEHVVELVDARQRRHRERALALLADALGLVDVVLVADVADDLLRARPRS